MLRELIANTGKIADATYTADVALVRGMGVQKLNGEAVLPTAVTGDDIFFVEKEPIPTGLDTVRGEISDYDDCFEKIPVGGYVKLIKYGAGEKVAVDQISAAIASGAYAVVGTDGKWKTAVTGNIARFISRGTYDDNDHSLTVLEGVDPHTVA